MMWIESDTNGQPQFVLDEAHVYRPTNQTPRWVLLKSEKGKSPNDHRVADSQSPLWLESRLYFPAVAKLQNDNSSAL